MNRSMRISFSIVLLLSVSLEFQNSMTSASEVSSRKDEDIQNKDIQIVMERDFAKNFIQFGLCEIDFHSRYLPCQYLDHNGFWNTMRFSWNSYKYVESRRYKSETVSAMDAVIQKAKNGIEYNIHCEEGAEKFDPEWSDMCPYINNIYQIYSEIKHRNGNLYSSIPPDELLTLIIVIGWITNSEKYSEMMSGNGGGNYSESEPFESDEGIATNMMCGIRRDLCNSRYINIFVKTPVFEMLKLYRNSFYANEYIFDHGVLDTGVFLEKLRIGWSTLEGFSFEYGHIQNVRLASSLTQVSMHKLEEYIGKKEE